jgi:hypothetical protein
MGEPDENLLFHHLMLQLLYSRGGLVEFQQHRQEELGFPDVWPMTS